MRNGEAGLQDGMRPFQLWLPAAAGLTWPCLDCLLGEGVLTAMPVALRILADSSPFFLAGSSSKGGGEAGRLHENGAAGRR